MIYAVWQSAGNYGWNVIAEFSRRDAHTAAWKAGFKWWTLSNARSRCWGGDLPCHLGPGECSLRGPLPLRSTSLLEPLGSIGGTGVCCLHLHRHLLASLCLLLLFTPDLHCFSWDRVLIRGCLDQALRGSSMRMQQVARELRFG